MRIRALVAILLSLVVWTPRARAEEVLHFDQKSLDLGPIGDDQSVIHAFPFTNSTQRTVRLAMSYCHFCAPPILDKQVLQPGESGNLVLELDPTGKRGPVSASVSIAEEGRPGTASEILLKGEVCPRVWVEPISMFPHIVRGRSFSSSFTVLGRSSAFKVADVHCDLPGVNVTIADPVEVQDCGAVARQQTVTVSFPTTMPLGRFNASLKVQTNDGQARPKLVTIDGEVAGRLTFKPEQLGAFLVPGEVFSKTFDVIAEQGPLMLSSLDVQAADEAQNLGIDAVPTGDPARVRVTVSGRAPLRERQAVDIRIRIAGSTLSEPGEDSLVVPITLIVFAKPQK